MHPVHDIEVGADLKAFVPTVIEIPKGSHLKYEVDKPTGLLKLDRVLYSAVFYPANYGFIPRTHGDDGDPLDILVLMDAPAFSGCLVPARLLGVIEAEQTERDGETTRNDRLIAVAADSRIHRDLRSLDDLSGALLEEIEYFFVSYNTIKGKVFKPLGRFGARRARTLVDEACERFARKHRRRSAGGKK